MCILKTSSNVCDDVPTKSSPSVSIVYDMINNSTACKETNMPLSIKQWKKIDTDDDDNVDPVSNNQPIRDKFDTLLQKEFPFL